MTLRTLLLLCSSMAVQACTVISAAGTAVGTAASVAGSAVRTSASVAGSVAGTAASAVGSAVKSGTDPASPGKPDPSTEAAKH